MVSGKIRARWLWRAFLFRGTNESCTDHERERMDLALPQGIGLPPGYVTPEALLAALAGLLVGLILAWLVLARPARRAEGEAAARAALAERRLAAMEVRAERADHWEEDARRLRDALSEAWAESAELSGMLEAERRDHRARVEELHHAEARIAHEFRSIASDVLGANAERFLDLASERFSRHSAAAAHDLAERRAEVAALVRPLAEQLGRFETRVGEVERAREGAFRAIETQVGAMHVANEGLRAETAKLVQALRQPNTRGRWGEMQLRQVFEMAGMVEEVDFVTEATLDDREGGRLRPDAVVRLPGRKAIVVDAKTPLDAYLNAIEAEDANAQTAALGHHARQLRTHVRQLSAKEYWSRLEASPEFVVMFIPGEAIYAAAIERDPTVFEDAFRSRVLIATPTTLIALVKAIAHGWQQERLAENAQAIAENARELHARLSTMGEHLAALGQALRQSVERYNRTLGALERRVLPAARRFQTLGVAMQEARLELPDAVEVDPSEVGAPELTASRDAAE